MVQPADAQLLASVFGFEGEARLEGPVDRGEQGQVWGLEVQGQHYALKETVAPLEEEQAQLAHAFQHTAAKAGVRSPEPILTRDGAVLVRVGAATLRLYRWVEMSGPDRMISAEEVGRCLARLHRSAPPIEARTHPWYSEPVGRDRWEKLTRLLGQQRAPFVDRLAALVDELVAVESVYVEPVDRMLCHRDLFADNVRVVPDGGLVVIDWDNCGAASADQELGMVLLEFGVDEDRVTRLYDSYCAAGGPGRVTVVSDLTMAAATVGHIGELACRQWLEATDEAARSRAVARVEEFLTEPWTLDVLERVVGVVGEASRGRDG